MAGSCLIIYDFSIDQTFTVFIWYCSHPTDTYVEKVGGPQDWRANQRPDEDPAFGAGVSMKPFTVHSEVCVRFGQIV